MTTVRVRYREPAAMVLILALAFAAMAPAYLAHYPLSWQSVAGIYLCFVAMLLLMVYPAVASTRHPVWLSIIWLFPYCIYAAGTHDFRIQAMARLVAAAAPLVLLYRLVPVRDEAKFCWQDLLAAAWLAAVLLTHQLAGVWNVPVNLDFFARLYLLIVGAWCWKWIRPVTGLGYEFRFGLETVKAAARNFTFFALVAIPLSLSLRFTHWNPRHNTAPQFLADFLQIFLFVALLEELFFRGFLQTLMAARFHSARTGQIVVACLFGLFHILHAPFPNWRYVLLASIAGWFYGAAFRTTGNLTAPALTHALVDTVWRHFF